MVGPFLVPRGTFYLLRLKESNLKIKPWPETPITFPKNL